MDSLSAGIKRTGCAHMLVDRDDAKDIVEFTSVGLGFDKPSVEIGLCDERRFWAKINGKWVEMPNKARLFVDKLRRILDGGRR